jgi:hypothetical protein
MFNALILILYYFFILLSILGYGIFFLKIFEKKIISINFGYVGLSGLYILLIYSYLSNFIIAHSQLHNFALLSIGVILFFLNYLKKLTEYRKEIFLFFLVFILISSSLFMFKNHDDFPYYHFPYTYYLTQQSFYIGVGQFNHGFRTPSSIFYINSLFYLPYAKFYLFHFTSIYILGFANIILLKKINSYFTYFKIKKEKINITNYLSLFSLIFINIFFYRIAEHGTDRSAQILIFLLIIELIIFINTKNIKNINLFKLYLLAALIVSLKAFYILYAVFFIPLLFLMRSKNKSYFKSIIFLVFNKYFALFMLLLFFVLFTYLINTGCVIYPLSITCFDNLNWGIPSTQALKMNNHYELWSKGGLTPTSRVSNPSEYIQGFYWVKNWINVYFFNKVSDFLLGLMLLVITVLYSFKGKSLNKYKYNYNYIYIIYLILIALGFEWFFNHPALRYGGYCIIALLFIIPACVKLESIKIDYTKYTRITVILIIFTVSVFNLRNIHRIIKEVNKYQYEPMNETFYSVLDGNFRIQKKMDKFIILYNNCINLDNECPLEEQKEEQKIYKKYGKIIFYNR